MRFLKLLLSLAASLALEFCYAQSVPTRFITVTESQTDEIAPSKADLSFGFYYKARTAKLAKDSTDRSIASMLKVLKAFQVRDKNVKTFDLSVSPVYNNSNSKVNGYETRQTLSVTITKLNKIEDLVDSLLKTVPGIRVDGLEWGVVNEDSVSTVVREKALRKAKKKASDMANTLEASIGQVFEITDSESTSRMNRRNLMALPASGYVNRSFPSYSLGLTGPQPDFPTFVSLRPGNIEVSVTVTVRFELK
jgi:uncharacterized protein YggE